MKYIVMQVRYDGHPVVTLPIAFPEILVHKLVAEQMRAMLHAQFFKADRVVEIEPISAGFMSSADMIGNGPDLCHGESTSLGLKARPTQDAVLFAMADYGGTLAANA